MESETVRSDRLATLDSGHESMGYATLSRTKREQSRAVLNMARNVKSTITRNNLKLIFVLNFLPLLGIAYCTYHWKWYLVRDDAFYQYWINPLLIGMKSKGEISEEDVSLIYTFKKSGCRNNKQLCDIIYPFFLSGVVSSLLLISGLAMHLFSIIQMAMIIRGRVGPVIKCISGSKIQLLVLFNYVAAYVYWFFASGLFLAMGDFTKFIGSIGFSVLIYFICLLLFTILMVYFNYTFAKGRKNAMVNKLLYAEQQLIQEIDDENNEDRYSP